MRNLLFVVVAACAAPHPVQPTLPSADAFHDWIREPLTAHVGVCLAASGDVTTRPILRAISCHPRGTADALSKAISMGSVWQDIRYALRMMAKTPGLTAVLVITLAVGIGASTTIFSVVNSIVIRPLPYAQPDRIVRVYTEFHGGQELPRFWMSPPVFDDIRRECRTCASIAAWHDSRVALGGGDKPVRVDAAYSTHELLPLLGVKPLLGRFFGAKEDTPGDPTVIVIGYDVWQRAFAGDPGIVGRNIVLDARTVTVVGVMPRTAPRP